MKGLAPLVALATLSGSAVAQTPPPGQVQVKIDVSPAGQAVLKKYLGVRDPVVVQHVEQLRAVGQQIGTLANAPRLDLGRLQALMRQQEAIGAAIQRRTNDRTLAMLGELSEADRLKFVRSLRDARAGAKPPTAR